MSEDSKFKCVNCGQSAAALYKTYGPTVLKLTKCEKCKGVVDKYIEYDPVIVMIDLVLVSKEAQRHILYNTDFKSFWKLLIILMMFETYGVWKNDSLFNIGVSTMCHMNNTHSMFGLNVPASWRETCDYWAHEDRADESDLFIWEKEFYIKFISILMGIVAFILTVQSSMMLIQPVFKHKAPPLSLLKAFSLANGSILFNLPMLVWGADTSLETKLIHYLLVFSYSFVVFLSVFTVLYSIPVPLTIIILTVSNILKYTTSFHVTSYMTFIMYHLG